MTIILIMIMHKIVRNVFLLNLVIDADRWLLKLVNVREKYSFGLVQGGRSCTGARVAPAKKFRLRRKF